MKTGTKVQACKAHTLKQNFPTKLKPPKIKTSLLKHYSSRHTILLVGEGDFSFSSCLSLAFGSAANIFATSLDSYDELVMKYKDVKPNLGDLEYLGASLLHGVDATTMKFHPRLHRKKFHRIIYNIPHAGFHGRETNPDVIMMHRNLVRGFLWNARSMLSPDGEVHINHKFTAPYRSWGMSDIALECQLVLVGLDDFKIEHYPGYKNKRGSGSRCDKPFPLGDCRTFIFKLRPVTAIFLKMESRKLHAPIHPGTMGRAKSTEEIEKKCDERALGRNFCTGHVSASISTRSRAIGHNFCSGHVSASISKRSRA